MLRAPPRQNVSQTISRAIICLFHVVDSLLVWPWAFFKLLHCYLLEWAFYSLVSGVVFESMKSVWESFLLVRLSLTGSMMASQGPSRTRVKIQYWDEVRPDFSCDSEEVAKLHWINSHRTKSLDHFPPHEVFGRCGQDCVGLRHCRARDGASTDFPCGCGVGRGQTSAPTLFVGLREG